MRSLFLMIFLTKSLLIFGKTISDALRDKYGVAKHTWLDLLSFKHT